MSDIVEISGLNHEGRGISYLNQKILFVENALPGETVLIDKVIRRGKFSLAKAIEIINPSPYRVQPICPHYNLCGGCSLQHLSSQEQIKLKSNTLKNYLENFGHLKNIPVFSPPILGPTERYRRKARLGVKYVRKKQRLIVGFHEKHRSFIADLTQCKILTYDLIPLLTPLIAELTIFDNIPQVEFAQGEGNAALIFRNLTPFTPEDLDKIRQIGENYNFQCYIQPGNLHTLNPVGKEAPLFYYYKDIGFTFLPASFIQINATINSALIDQVLTWIDPQKEDYVLELFCGIGNFSLPIAREVKSIWGLEGDASAVKQAQINATLNHLSNLRFTTTDLSQTWPVEINNWPMNKLLLDPPRTGAANLCERMLPERLERIVYISCNSATFARDAGILEKQGFNLSQIKLADMYPHTAHIEIIALFQPR